MAKQPKGKRRNQPKGKGRNNTKNKSSRRRISIHDVVDRISAFETSVRGGTHAQKTQILRFAAAHRRSWEAFCEALTKLGTCDESGQFCHF